METIPFTTVYILGQILFTLLLWTFNGFYLELTVSAKNAALVFIGGFSVLHAEYFFIAAVERMSASSAIASFCIFSAIIGIPLDFYFEENSHVDGLLLFTGTALILSGLIIFVFAESLIPDHCRAGKQNLSPRSVATSVSEVESSNALICGCVLGTIGGIFNSVWSVMGAITGCKVDGFNSPITLLLVYDAGQLAALPFVFAFFGHFDVLRLRPPTDSGATYLAKTWEGLLRVPPAEIIWALVIGCVVGLGYWGYFSSTIRPDRAVPHAVAYALTFCDMLVSLYASIFIFSDYGSWHSIAVGGSLWLVLVVGTACYAAGVLILAFQLV